MCIEHPIDHGIDATHSGAGLTALRRGAARTLHFLGDALVQLAIDDGSAMGTWPAPPRATAVGSVLTRVLNAAGHVDATWLLLPASAAALLAGAAVLRLGLLRAATLS